MNAREKASEINGVAGDQDSKSSPIPEGYTPGLNGDLLPPGWRIEDGWYTNGEAKMPTNGHGFTKRHNGIIVAGDEEREVTLFPKEVEDDGAIKAREATEEQEKARAAANDKALLDAARAVVYKEVAVKKAKMDAAGRKWEEPLDEQMDLWITKELVKQKEKAEKAKEREKERVAKLAAKADEEQLRSAKLLSQPWTQDWYYLKKLEKVMRVGGREPYSKQAFDAIFAAKSGSKTSYDDVRMGAGFKEAAGASYAPSYPPVFTFQGQTFLNLYRPDSAPVAAPEYTDEGYAAVLTVRYHLVTLFGSDDAARIESWIALNVRNPGKLIGCALLVKGTPGDGKTVIFMRMMSKLMGEANVSDVSLDEINSTFTGWATGAALRGAEELKVPGNNRHVVTNKIKPFITNDRASSVAKRENGKMTPNTTNYVGLTNYENALPMDRNDRRWWVLFTQFKKKADIAAFHGDPFKYFARLYKTIDEEFAALRKYFLEDCEIHPDVHHGMWAPDTAAKNAMVSEEEDAHGRSNLQHYISTIVGGDDSEELKEDDDVAAQIADDSKEAKPGRYGVTYEVVSTKCLAALLDQDMGVRVSPKTKQIADLLVLEGYYKFGQLDWKMPGVDKFQSMNVYVRDKDLVIKNVADKTEANTKRRKVLALLKATSDLPTGIGMRPSF